MTLFSEITRNVACRHGFVVPDYSAVETWLRTELAKIAK
jgi:hypothetical protein